MDEKLVPGKPIAVVLGVLLVSAGLFKWWPSDQRAIHRQLDAIADTLTVPSTDTALSKITRLNELRNYFTPDASVRLGTLSLPTRDAVLAAAERWSPPPGGVFVAFADDIIQVKGDTANISLTLKTSSRDQGSGETVVDARDAAIRMAKQNGDWLITNVESPAASEKARPGSP